MQPAPAGVSSYKASRRIPGLLLAACICSVGFSTPRGHGCTARGMSGSLNELIFCWKDHTPLWQLQFAAEHAWVGAIDCKDTVSVRERCHVSGAAHALTSRGAQLLCVRASCLVQTNHLLRVLTECWLPAFCGFVAPGGWHFCVAVVFPGACTD